MKLKFASKPRKPFVEVYAAHQCVENEQVVYRLLEGNSKFFLEVGYNGECVILPLGCSIARAATVFERFWKGTVTPCTAKDVLSDLLLSLD